ncbi:hypothetical protein KR51_00017410 [Rubidibacter lacunae KORDI 51-2]|uniref:Uncharacterized protein n=1 Tax=Rubidibacter lacunae KORDI 51-2 TaxID=582515 RepID=U5DLB7_9CHRO|nr:hypothetical protein [Rubidibacter lacunae]ERN41662.1 hypothetical protein KR51_00017410 [Rubidibacter lacunae KORDI 51-2]
MSLRRPPLPTEILLGLMTAPVLVGLTVGRSVGQACVGFGEACEELLRGDRLPVLHFSQDDESEMTSDS